MPVFFQQQINESTRLGVWKIEESEEFFKGNVPVHRDVTHPHKRLQHLAGRFLLQYLFPDFPYELITIADTRKPFLAGERYHFSISHCGDYAAAIVSKTLRVGVDIEIPTDKTLRIVDKYLSEQEKEKFGVQSSGFKVQGEPINDLKDVSRILTLLWSCKEAVFKWFGDGNVDFKKDIHLLDQNMDEQLIDVSFKKNNQQLQVHYHEFDHLMLTWVLSIVEP